MYISALWDFYRPDLSFYLSRIFPELLPYRPGPPDRPKDYEGK